MKSHCKVMMGGECDGVGASTDMREWVWDGCMERDWDCMMQ